VHARAVLVCDNGVLTFEDVDAHRDHTTCTAVARIRYEEHRIALDQITPYVLDMLGFFEELVSDSAGWPGVKSWRSEATEMRVEARFERGFVRFEIAVRWLAVRDGETWRGRLRVEHDKLAEFVETLRELLGLERGARFTVM